MTKVMDYTGYLAQEIGARPAGTEEEQQAALYITEQFQKDAGFTASIEEFTNSTNFGASRAILALVVIAVTLLAIIFPILNIPAFILAAAAAAVYVVESLERPLLARFLSRGASQNVIAKYQPNFDEAANGPSRVRGRKVILVAHYDTDHVTPALVERVESLGLPLPLICMVAMIVAAFFQLLRIFVAPGGGMGLIVLNVLSIIALIVCALPAVKALLIRQAPYNEGANNNATGAAALIEVARRIARGSVSEADLAQEADDELHIHGEQAAREAGLIPEGAQIRYEAEQLVPPSDLGDYDEEERLLSAKAAIAALTGKPVERRVYGSVAGNLVNSRTHDTAYDGVDEYGDFDYEGSSQQAPALQRTRFDDPVDQDWGQGQGAPMGIEYAGTGTSSGDALSAPVAVEPAGATADGFENAPSWFIAAQQNARKSQPVGAGQPPDVQRSKYNEAIENAERGRAIREEELRAAARAEREQQAREALVARTRTVPYDDAGAGYDANGYGEDAAGMGADAQDAAFAPQSDFDAPFDQGAEGAAPGASGEFDMPGDSGDPGAHANPSSTIAMSALVPAAEIAAEAALLEAQEQEGERIQVSADDDVSDQESAPRNRILGLPSIDTASDEADDQSSSASEGATSPSKSGILRRLRTNIPSLSGLINPITDDGRPSEGRTSFSAAADAKRAAARRNAAASVPSVDGSSPAPASRRPRHASVSVPSVEEPPAAPVEEEVDYDMEVPLRIPSAPSRAEMFTMEVPRSRSASLLKSIRGDDNSLQETPQEWLDVDEDYEARSVGRERGSWESFRDDRYSDQDEPAADSGTGDSGRKAGRSATGRGSSDRRAKRSWQGGAYSRMQLGHVDMRSGADAEADEMIPEELPEEEIDRSLTGELEQIYHFRNPQFNTEIWFVALGSDGDGHDGVRAFLDEHRDELRGSMVIEVESLGVGTLAVAKEEGRVRKLTASSRIKRYTRAAVAATGLAIDEVSLAGTDSIASTVQRAGFQVMHLFGAENGRPALKGSADDVFENIDELTLDDNVNFIFELLKH